MIDPMRFIFFLYSEIWDPVGQKFILHLLCQYFFMVEIRTFNDFQEFLDFNKKELFANYFIYYHFIILFDALAARKIELFDAYNVLGEDGNSAICICVTDNYFIYSHKWNNEIVQKIIEKKGIERYKDFFFLGQRGLIVELFEAVSIKFEVFKDRLIYECFKVTPSAKAKIGQVEYATYDNFDELVSISMDNYIEEYYGKGQKTIEEMRFSVSAGIDKSSLFLLRHENNICSIMQIINDNEEEPMIGNLFTKKELRNKGYAFSLLYTVTERLLENRCNKCGLISDINNPASNKVFDNIGYSPIYKWITVIKK